MTLTRTQKIYGAVMIVAAGALVWDRSSTGPAKAVASAGDSPLLQSTPKPIADIRSGRDDSSNSFAASAAGNRFRQRMAILARDEQLDPAAAENAFGLPKKWLTKPLDPALETVNSPVLSQTQTRIETFRQHHLAAVMVGHRGYANVDGQGIFVGESLDGFKLISVTKTTALFELDGSPLELHLVSEIKVNRKGSVIENAAPRSGSGPLK